MRSVFGSLKQFPPIAPSLCAIIPGVPMDQQKPYDLVHLRSIDAEGRKGLAWHGAGGWWWPLWAEDWTVKTHSFDNLFKIILVNSLICPYTNLRKKNLLGIRYVHFTGNFRKFIYELPGNKPWSLDPLKGKVPVSWIHLIKVQQSGWTNNDLTPRRHDVMVSIWNHPRVTLCLVISGWWMAIPTNTDPYYLRGWSTVPVAARLINFQNQLRENRKSAGRKNCHFWGG